MLSLDLFRASVSKMRAKVMVSSLCAVSAYKWFPRNTPLSDRGGKAVPLWTCPAASTGKFLEVISRIPRLLLRHSSNRTVEMEKWPVGTRGLINLPILENSGGPRVLASLGYSVLNGYQVAVGQSVA